MRRVKIGIIFVGLLTGLILGTFAFAQERGVTISPLNFELTANPGDSLENKIRVSNPTTSNVSIKMEVEDFTASGEIGQVIVEKTEDTTYSLKRWVKINPAEFTLKPGEQKFVTFTINVPKNAEPGGKYGSILAVITGVAGPGTIGTGITTKVGALVLLAVSGDVKEEINVEGFSAPKFSEYGPINFVIRLKNTGTVHLRPRGLVTITNIFGSQVANVEFAQQNVIPGAIRRIEAKWDEGWLWGLKYQATLVGSYGSQNNPISAVTTFWVFPWKVVLLAIIILSLIIYFAVRTVRKVKRAEEILKQKKMEEEKKNQGNPPKVV